MDPRSWVLSGGPSLRGACRDRYPTANMGVNSVLASALPVPSNSSPSLLVS